MFITGFPAGMLACNCYVLAPRQGADAIVVDPGQRAMGPLRRILDENRLTPAAVLLTHGHIDHMWSAQKVADTYGCATYIHPADRFMLADPIKGFGAGFFARFLAGAFLAATFFDPGLPGRPVDAVLPRAKSVGFRSRSLKKSFWLMKP